MLRYSPRQVTIAPGSSQTVRMLLRKPAELAPGEYRSHLQFDRVADSSPGNSVDSAADAGGDKVGVVITALVGASIPVIVRQGETQATVTLAQLALEPRGADAAPSLAFQILREGNRSVYGDLAVTFTPRGGTPLEVAKAGGVAVYVPNPMRRARMPLQLPAGVALAGGSLRLSYRERADSGGKLLAEQTLQAALIRSARAPTPREQGARTPLSSDDRNARDVRRLASMKLRSLGRAHPPCSAARSLLAALCGALCLALARTGRGAARAGSHRAHPAWLGRQPAGPRGPAGWPRPLRQLHRLPGRRPGAAAARRAERAC